MYIPPTSSVDPSILSFENTVYGSRSYDFALTAPAGGWSSLIGIVTAIVGNILISFALNTQRYAHLRLNQERDNEEETRREARRKHGRRKGTGYGTEQAEIAEERAQENADSRPAGGKMELAEDGERLPLLAGSSSQLKRKGSNSTESSESADGGYEKEGEETKSKSYLRSPYWWLGISLMTVGEAGNFLAYGFAPASVVSPLGVVALVSNCLIAPLMLHEKFRWRDALGVVIAVAGCVTVVLSASGSDPKLDQDAIWDLVTQWEFETYMGVTIFLIIALAVASNKFGDRSILIDLGLVGLLGGYTALATKGVASLLTNSIWRVVTFPITYVLLVVLVFTAVMQIKYVNRALQRFNATMVIPTQFVLFTLSVIIGSAILYRDFERRSAADAGKFVGGCALTFLGVWCITSGRGNEKEHDEESADEEDAVDLLDAEGVQPEIRERDYNERRPSTAAATRTSAKTAPPTTHPSEDAPPTLLVTPDFGPTKDHPDYPTLRMPVEPFALHTQPGNMSAIHASDFAETQQTDSNTGANGKSSQPPPKMHATTSAPVVPTLPPTTPQARPKTPRLNRGISGPASPAPRTPRQQANLDPNISPQKLLSRNSFAGLLPDLGPLTSPLSSSLSAIVADSLRRGVDPGSAASMRRKSLHGRRSQRKIDFLQPDAEPRKRHSIASGEMEFGDRIDEEESASGDQAGRLRPAFVSPRSRGRSLSATIADMFTSSADKRPAGEGGNSSARPT